MRTLFTVAALALSLSHVASAGTIISNLGGAEVGGWGITDSFWSATRFTTDGSAYVIDDVVMRLTNSDFRSDSGVFAAIYSDNAGAPGSQLASKLTTATDLTSTPANIVFTHAGSAANLSANTDYWVVFGVDDAASDANPLLRRTADTGSGPGTMHLDIWTSTNGGLSWSVQQPGSALGLTFLQEVNGTAINSVPEPSSLALLGMGVTGLFGCGWRRKCQQAA